jgi:hypothetical protein
MNIKHILTNPGTLTDYFSYYLPECGGWLQYGCLCSYQTQLRITNHEQDSVRQIGDHQVLAFS